MLSELLLGDQSVTSMPPMFEQLFDVRNCRQLMYRLLPEFLSQRLCLPESLCSLVFRNKRKRQKCVPKLFRELLWLLRK